MFWLMVVVGPQAGRRNLTDDQRVIAANEVRELRSQIVVARKLEAARVAKASSMSDVSADIEKTDTRKEVAAEYIRCPRRSCVMRKQIKKVTLGAFAGYSGCTVAAKVRPGVFQRRCGWQACLLPLSCGIASKDRLQVSDLCIDPLRRHCEAFHPLAV